MASATTAPTPVPISAADLARRLTEAEREGAVIQLVDVREDEELELARLPHPAVHLPLSRSSEWIGRIGELLDPARPVAVLCHAGVRSWHFACWLIEEHGFEQVWNVRGGIDAWSVEVDPEVPRY
jgi:hypothetical protein